ncbi:hypothetical protein CBR_g223 [Chara braunii]|uniref:2-carboxy-D-arabinitol-1-phosphatase n=1 Tax=Chara braunii TaxID=69332 RepID=A0A388JM84_CHABU|nr:hypothetical protein CBR_g223 [Chara braunii]|eukprot:GBG58822.1 hypothetical protein CBR_g223 [Chara braunii]
MAAASSRCLLGVADHVPLVFSKEKHHPRLRLVENPQLWFLPLCGQSLMRLSCGSGLCTSFGVQSPPKTVRKELCLAIERFVKGCAPALLADCHTASCRSCTSRCKNQRLKVLAEASPSRRQGHRGAAMASSQTLVGKPLDTSIAEAEQGEKRVVDSAILWRRALPPIKEAKRVVLVRHGQSTWNHAGRIQGSSNFSVLTDKGKIQAATSRQMLSDAAFDACFFSPLARAKETAEIIWGERDAPAYPIHDLREIDLYAFEGLYKQEGKDRFGDAYRMWQRDAKNFVIDDHFPVRELWDRARQCWDTILLSEYRSILVVAHNAVNQALIATAMGLGPEYFRQLLQSNCGVSVLDFKSRDNINSSSDEPVFSGPPYVCLDRLNQTPSPPIAVRQSGGRNSGHRLLLVCNGATDSSSRSRFPASDEEPMNMLGVVQARKTAELLLDCRVDKIICSPLARAVQTAQAIAEIQEGADCLGVDCVPRDIEIVKLDNLRDMDMGGWKGALVSEHGAEGEPWQERLLEDGMPHNGEPITDLWNRVWDAWQGVLHHLGEASSSSANDVTEVGPKTLVVVGHETVHLGMIARCLKLSPTALSLFHLDTGSVSVIDFPDGPTAEGIVRCLNYTAHLGRWAVPITRTAVGDEDF